MANFGEMSGLKQVAVVVGGALLVSAGVLHRVQDPSRPEAAAQQKRKPRSRETRKLESYRPQTGGHRAAAANLKQQLEIERRIGGRERSRWFAHAGCEASKAGTNRRYTSKPQRGRFYTEVPFEMELDGPYYRC